MINQGGNQHGNAATSSSQGDSWQGTWARLPDSSRRDDASLLQRNFYLPSAHYNDDQGAVYGAGFNTCMRFPGTASDIYGTPGMGWESAARSKKGVKSCQYIIKHLK